jgi:hypothetical protein
VGLSHAFLRISAGNPLAKAGFFVEIQDIAEII